MPTQPTVNVIDDSSQAAQITTSGEFDVVILGECADGLSLNVDGSLIRINSADEIELKLGRVNALQTLIDVVRVYLDIAQTPLWVGRITGAGGVRAQTPVILDFQGVPVATVRARWRGLGIEGNRYSLRVSRGRYSTTDVGAGRVDTKYELLLGTTVLQTLDETVMDVASEKYAVNAWNNLGVACELLDQTPNDAYVNTNEPAVGTYAFTGGTAPVVATTTERTAAATALAAVNDLTLPLIGFYSFPDSDAATLVNAVAAKRWTTIPFLSENATAAAGATFVAALPTSADVAVHSGWGTWWRNKTKRIPGLPQVLAHAALGARENFGLAVNKTNARRAENRWFTFDKNVDLPGFAAVRVNPMWKISNRTQKGVVINDVLSLSLNPDYEQWTSGRTVNMVVGDILEFLKANVEANDNYLFGNKIGGVNADVSVDSLNKIDGLVADLFTRYPKTLLTGDRKVGWEWRGDVLNGATSPEPVFYLGVSPAKVARIIWLRYGKVAGRFEAAAVTVATPGGA
jgi:hypothetical protein